MYDSLFTLHDNFKSDHNTRTCTYQSIPYIQYFFSWLYCSCYPFAFNYVEGSLYIRGFNGENNPLSKVEKILTRHWVLQSMKFFTGIRKKYAKSYRYKTLNQEKYHVSFYRYFNRNFSGFSGRARNIPQTYCGRVICTLKTDHGSPVNSSNTTQWYFTL